VRCSKLGNVQKVSGCDRHHIEVVLKGVPSSQVKHGTSIQKRVFRCASAPGRSSRLRVPFLRYAFLVAYARLLHGTRRAGRIVERDDKHSVMGFILLLQGCAAWVGNHYLDPHIRPFS